jgi:hypothetical protein
VKRVEGKGQYEVVELLPYPESWSAHAWPKGDGCIMEK